MNYLHDGWVFVHPICARITFEFHTWYGDVNHCPLLACVRDSLYLCSFRSFPQEE